MARLSDSRLLRLIRQHVDLDGLLAAHPEVARADIDALWRRLGAEEPSPPIRQPGLFGAEARESSGARVVIARCDGAARGNPGPAAVGAVLQDPSGATLAEISERIGSTTNNVAEYQAVIRATERALKLGAGELRLLLDSELLVHQLRGAYRVKAPHLRPLYEQAMDLLRRFRKWSVQHVPREENWAADRLANQALDAR